MFNLSNKMLEKESLERTMGAPQRIILSACESD
jgi:hypothetical protein